MKILVLGAGKTGSLVAEVARERGHAVRVLTAVDNADGCALTEEFLADYDVAIDFTTPDAVMHNIAACVKQKTPMVVGTTGWYNEVDQVKKLVDASSTGFVYGSNFSVGVNLFFEIVRTAAMALRSGYSAQIMERHHIHKKDAPSGTAVTLKQMLERASGTQIGDVASIREGETVGMHVVTLDSPADTMMLVHDAKSRHGFAEGAVRAAEWLSGKTGFYEFADIYKQLGA
jgi:4-hydroxy-tetrahydrodipicolinate reductase